MTQEITIAKRPLLMKSGLTHWVTEETAGRIQNQLQVQSAHSFMKILELGITINTAEIEGVYTTDSYKDVLRIKAGEWQCVYSTWHPKKGDCECKKEMFRKQAADRQARERFENERELTPVERVEQGIRMKKMREIMEKKGILTKKLTVTK